MFQKDVMLLYLYYTVEITSVKCKFVRSTVVKNTTYVYYEYDHTFNREKQFTNVSLVTIGTVSPSGSRLMILDQNCLNRFPGEKPPVFKDNSRRSSFPHIGSNIVPDKIIHECWLPEILEQWFPTKELGGVTGFLLLHHHLREQCKSVLPGLCIQSRTIINLYAN